MKILRVFPRKTNMTPDDDLVYFGPPGLFRPEVDEVHVSVTFSWDIRKATSLYEDWKIYYPNNIHIGGPAWVDSDFTNNFTPGLYVKSGITFTSRGCNFDCQWCLVPKREGSFREIEIHKGNIIQDNNILLSSKNHLNKVFQMLKNEKAICFKGIDCLLLKDWQVEQMRSLKIKEIWLALDDWGKSKYFEGACKKLLKAGFKRNNIRAYVLAGFNEPVMESEGKLRFAYECGSLPFVQLYQDGTNRTKRKEEIQFIRSWSRPAAIKAIMNKELL